MLCVLTILKTIFVSLNYFLVVIIISSPILIFLNQLIINQLKDKASCWHILRTVQILIFAFMLLKLFFWTVF